MSTDRIEIHASPDGSPYADGSFGYPTDGLLNAITLVRRLREPGQRAVVWLHPGEFTQRETLELGPQDSFTTFAALDAARPPVIRGAEPVTGWVEIATPRGRVYAAPAPRDRGRCLYVGGERAPRPRYPRDGLLRIAEQEGLDPSASFVGTLFDGADRFRFAEGDVPRLSEPGAVEVVVPHYWVQERLPIASIDHERREIVSDRRSIFALRDDSVEDFARFYLDNVVEAFGEVPGEWYLDVAGTTSGAVGPQVLYVPRDGEEPAGIDVRMPVLDVLVQAVGTEAAPIREVRFENVGFADADFAETPVATPPFGVREDPMLPADGRFAAAVQAANTVPAALGFTFARSCAVVDCAVERVGGYGVAFVEGCRGNLVSGTRFADLGAGAIRSAGSGDPSAPGFNTANEVTDCTISRGGRTYPGSVGILFEHGSHNVIAHNEISDLFYTGISVGWSWGYGDSPSQDNRILGNRIHHLGQGVLNDMGGIYLLGIAPGTVVRGNHIHDVRCANYGGWGIYLDEGSSHVVVEGNVVHDVSSQAFHQHYGREVIVRNNVLAFGGQGQVTITRPESHVSLTFERNIVLGDHSPGFVGQEPRGLAGYRVYSDLNLFWDLEPVPGAVRAADGRTGHGGADSFVLTAGLDADWAAWGNDRHSITADPCFLDVAARDFRTAPDSPAAALGIVVPDVTGAGPRPTPARQHPLRPLTLPDQFAPTRAVTML
ncbi:MAG: right-handed parallel beta-helix repeat-containing protein [Actinobacteria bacterium]|nr:right-handed parallel beta-helix repeat-containing protein [Actinomycetota bacterium]